MNTDESLLGKNYLLVCWSCLSLLNRIGTLALSPLLKLPLLERLNKLQKQICRTTGPSFTASLQILACCQNIASLSLFYRYWLSRCLSELDQLVSLPYFVGDIFIILIDSINFLSPFLNVIRVSKSIVSFLPQLDSGILWL